MKHIRYLFEGLICVIFLTVFKLMPLDWASGCGGFFARNIGPRLAASRKARRNLQNALPALSSSQCNTIIKGMWDNLGRVFAEYPHMRKIAKERITFENQNMFQDIQQSHQGALFISAHLGNWEISAITALLRYDLQVDITYRPPNNPYVDRLLGIYRTLGGRINAYSKSVEGGRKMMTALKNKGYIAILLDQKYNEGLPIPFFGRYAMTNPIAAQLSLRYDIPMYPVECFRTNGANFYIKIYPAIKTRTDENAPLPLETILTETNSLLESWVRQHPEQWIWMHKRWDSQKVKELERMENDQEQL